MTLSPIHVAQRPAERRSTEKFGIPFSSQWRAFRASHPLHPACIVRTRSSALLGLGGHLATPRPSQRVVDKNKSDSRLNLTLKTNPKPVDAVSMLGILYQQAVSAVVGWLGHILTARQGVYA